MVPDILTVTLNPALDITTSTPRVMPGPKLRCAPPDYDPGGGGINVSRAITKLGGTSTAFVAHGGSTGQRLLDLLRDESIQVQSFSIPGETRQSIVVNDASTHEQYRFVMPGPLWTANMTEDCIAAVARTAPQDGYVILSGSQPPGVPDDFTTRLAKAHGNQRSGLFVDTSGEPLHQLVKTRANIAVLRMDAAEAQDLSGLPLLTRSDTAAFGRQLVQQNVAEKVLIARGADGTTLITTKENLHCARAVHHVVSAVGAGDSFVGGFALALSQGASDADALRHGTAAASSAMLTEATKLCTREGTERLLPECQLTQV